MFKPDNISTPIPFQVNVPDAVALAEGDAAAERIIGGGVLVDHMQVARALMVGSRIAAKEAGTNQGKPYNIAFSRWLGTHPKLAAVNKPNRAAALWCLDPANWPRVEKYFATLDIAERQVITLRTVRRRLDVPPPRPTAVTTAATTSPSMPVAQSTAVTPPLAQPVAKVAPIPAASQVREAADRAEIATLKAELRRLRGKLDQLSMYLAEKPQLKAEDRPVVNLRYWPLPEKLEAKSAPQRQIQDPPADVLADPAFALRREEFEQFLVRRREALEAKYAAKEKALKESFEPSIKARVKAAVTRQMQKERLYSSPLTEAQLKTLLLVLHPDSRDKATTAQKDSAARILITTRARLAFKDRDKGSTYVPAEPAPDAQPAQAEATSLTGETKGGRP